MKLLLLISVTAKWSPVIANDKKDNLKKLFGKKKIILELKQTPKQIANTFTGYDYKIDNNNMVTLECDTDFQYSKLVSQLAKSNTEINNITTKDVDIEDIFRNLVYKD